jgi:hypothetical protein
MPVNLVPRPGAAAITVCHVTRTIADWWDALELWLTQLAFPFQVALAIVVVLPLCWLAAGLLDRAAGVVVEALRKRR